MKRIVTMARAVLCGVLSLGVTLTTACGSHDRVSEARNFGTLAIPLRTTVGSNTYRLDAVFAITGAQGVVTLATSGDDPVLSTTLPAGSYSALLQSFTLSKADATGTFHPVSATVVSSSEAFIVFADSTTTVNFQFETADMSAPPDAGNVSITFGVTETGECTVLGPGCPDGYWCAPPALTGMPAACLPSGTTPIGSACASPLECVAPSTCHDFGTGPVCTSLCAPDEFGQPCATGGTCIEADASYGLCACTDGGRTHSCATCPPGYSGTVDTGCTPKLCDGAPDLDCACIEVTPDGDDAAAIANHGLTPFHDVQVAMDYAFEHPEVASKVCVVNGPDCSRPSSADAWPTYPGPESGDFTMRDGVSLYGSYESTSFTRCDYPKTALSLTSPAGVVFPDTIAQRTVIDGFDLHHFEAPASTGITVRGARNVVASSLVIDGGDTAVDLYGVDLSNGAQATLQDVAVLMRGYAYFPGVNPSGKVYGIRAIDSELTVDDCGLELQGGTVSGVWLENATGGAVTNSAIQNDLGTGVGIHIEGAAATLSGNTLRSGDVGIEIVDVDDMTLSATITDQRTGLKVLRSKVNASISSTSSGPDTGVLLDTSPGSVLHVETGQAVSTAFGNLVSVVGDATGTVISASAYVYGTGISFSDCGGAAPLVTNSSLRATIEAIHSFGACHPRIENNAQIAGITRDATNAIHCGGGSLCTINDNADIHADIQENLAAPSRVTVAGIRCEAGSCGDIIGNHVRGPALSFCNNLPQVYTNIASYGIIYGGNGTVTNNVVSAGCGAYGAGVVASGGLIESNDISGPTARSSHNIGSPTCYGLDVSGSVIVDSNTMSGGGADLGGAPCTGAGLRFSGGDGIFRNNSIGNGCSASVIGGVATIFQNNALSSYLFGSTLLTDMDLINALGPGYSGNF